MHLLHGTKCIRTTAKRQLTASYYASPYLLLRLAVLFPSQGQTSQAAEKSIDIAEWLPSFPAELPPGKESLIPTV
jgi:hypothetical protein